MANPFYSALNPPAQAESNIFQMAQQLKANPLQFILQQKLNIPMNLMNNPNAMLDYLVRTNQVPQSRVDWANQQLSQMKR